MTGKRWNVLSRSLTCYQTRAFYARHKWLAAPSQQTTVTEALLTGRHSPGTVRQGTAPTENIGQGDSLSVNAHSHDEELDTLWACPLNCLSAGAVDPCQEGMSVTVAASGFALITEETFSSVRRAVVDALSRKAEPCKCERQFTSLHTSSPLTSASYISLAVHKESITYHG